MLDDHRGSWKIFQAGGVTMIRHRKNITYASKYWPIQPCNELGSINIVLNRSFRLGSRVLETNLTNQNIGQHDDNYKHVQYNEHCELPAENKITTNKTIMYFLSLQKASF